MSRRIGIALAAALVSLAALASSAGAATVTQFSGLSENVAPLGIATGPDGNLWFAEGAEKRLGTMTPAGGYSSKETSGKLLAVTAGPDGKIWFAQSEGTTELGTVDLSTGKVIQYPLTGAIGGLTAGPEGDIWFTVENGGGEAAIGRAVASTGAVTEFKIAASSKPAGITVGPEGNLWFTEPNANAGQGAIGSFNPATEQPHECTTVNGLTVSSVPTGIAAGADGNLWFTENKTTQIGRVNPQTCAISQFGGLTEGKPQEITAGSDGNLYFTESGGEGALGQITPSGAITEYKGGTIGLSKRVEPWGITSGPDGNIWFTEKGRPAAVGRLTVAPSVASAVATNVGSQAATLSARVGANAQATYYFFEYGATAAYGSYSTTGSAGNGGIPVSMSATIGGLSAATTYHFRSVAFNATGTTYGADTTFTTAPVGGGSFGPASGSPAPVAGGEWLHPVLGSSAGAQPTSGTILVQQPSGAFVPLSGARTLPVGTVIDATRGAVRLITAIDRHGRTQSVTVWGGVFEIRQSKTEGGYTRIILRGALPSCRRGRGAHASSARTRVKVRKLWAADNHGKYSTYGANSVATVRGTRWETEDTCAGTRTRVAEGEVSVRDLHRHKTVLVKAGGSYLARS
jgi:streptogramin lyase